MQNRTFSGKSQDQAPLANHRCSACGIHFGQFLSLEGVQGRDGLMSSGYHGYCRVN